MATAKKTPAKKAAPVTKAAPAKTAAAKASKVATPVAAEPAPGAKRAVNAAFMKALTPSPALAAIVGSDALPRTEVVKQMWVYIKANHLQDATNKRLINADAKLKEVFGKDSADMFEMQKLISQHLK